MVGEYGLETLYEVERRRLKSVTDVLVLLTHWEITSSVGLVCVGSGETNTCTEPSELLPADWNSDGTVYSLKYEDPNNKQQYILKVLSMDDSAVMSFLRTSDQKNTDLTLTPTSFISELSDYQSTLKQRGELLTKLRNELVGPLQPDRKDKKQEEEEERRRRREEADRRKRIEEEEEDNNPLRIRNVKGRSL